MLDLAFAKKEVMLIICFHIDSTTKQKPFRVETVDWHTVQSLQTMR